jgi:hypothetical protein
VAVLRIELQDGFAGDEVVCTLDGREVARLSDVRTSLVTSLAAVVEVDAPDAGPFDVGVSLPEKGLRTDVTVRDPDTERWVVAHVVDGRLVGATATEPPPHL